MTNCHVWREVRGRIVSPRRPASAPWCRCLYVTHASRTHQELVENWLWWAVFTLARRRNPDVDLAIRTAHKALIRHWSSQGDDDR